MDTPSLERFGGFAIGGMQLALPMESLREVIPCGPLLDLPSPAPCVIGGINLRDVLIPVVDLRVVLNRDVAKAEFPCVIIMAHEGKIVGLLADAVTGIFTCHSDKVNRIQVLDQTASVFFGSIHRDDTDSLVNVLSPKALSLLHQVPMVDDPEPDRQRTQEDRDEVIIQDDSLPLMLVRCGRLPLAIDAMIVHTTVSHPDVQPSVLAMGHCRGVMDYADTKVPVVDLQSLCGLGTLDHEVQSQAFLVNLPQGMVGFLVSEVVDVIRAMPQDLIKVPGFALACPELFAGALPMSALPAELLERTGIVASQYLLMDGAALKTCDEVVALSQANARAVGTSSADAASFVASMGRDGGKRSMITYALSSETATPLEQVQEILPYASDAEIFESSGPLLGFMVNRGRSIPVVCLSRLMGGVAQASSPATSVLVVASDGDLVGFAVPQLKSIEPADWEPELPDMGSSKARKLALVGMGGSARMLPVIDLLQVASSVREQRLA